MIRINLLPVKAARRRETVRLQVVGGLAVVALAVVGIVGLHVVKSSELDRLRAEQRELDEVITRLKRELGDYDLIKAQRGELLRQKEVIARLQRARSGPAYAMRELSDILTPGKGPTFNKDLYEEALKRDPNAAINLGWDPRRAWLLQYAEKDRLVSLHVAARTDDDVAEFLKRLKLSAFFSEVYWKQTQPQYDPKLNVAWVTFDVACRVNY